MRMMGPRGRLALTLGLMAILGACDPLPAYSQVGVTKDRQGRVELIVKNCPDNPVREIRLYQQVGPDFDDGDDELLWAIRSPGERADLRLTLGRTPPGFEEVHRLEDEPVTSGELVVKVHSQRATAAIGFSDSELRGGEVKDGLGRFMQEEEFFEVAGQCTVD